MKDKKARKTKNGGKSHPQAGPVLNHPDKPGEPKSASGPDFGQSIESGGMD